MVYYVTLFVVYFVLVGLWLWAVAKWTGIPLPIPDILITAVCERARAVRHHRIRLVYGWLLGLIILALIRRAWRTRTCGRS